MVAEDIDHDLDDQIDEEHVANGNLTDSGGQDVEPPYLKLRAFSDDRDADATSSGEKTPALDLTEFAVAEGASPPPFPQGATGSTPIALQDMAWAGVDPSGPLTESIARPRSRFALSRASLIGWGALAFSAGLVASAAGAHILVAPSRPTSTASAAVLAPQTPVASPPVATVPAPPPAAVAPAPVAAAVPVPVAAAPAPAVQAPTPPAPTLAAAMPAPVRTRAGATPQPRSKARTRGKVRPEPRGSDGPTETAEGDWAPTPATTEHAAPSARGSSGWVDPFAQ